MSLKTVNPYLTFNGNAAEALDFYVGALGATVVVKQPFKDMPGSDFTGADGERIMHATLQLGEGQLMLSDAMPGQEVGPGTNTSITLQYADTSIVDAHFAALAEGGQVTMPLENTFWNARFGVLVDRFGISWMFNAELAG